MTPPPQPADVPIAIVGMGCRLPGANDVDGLWRLVRDGESRTAPLPEDRLDRDLLFHPERGVRNRTYSDLACLVDYAHQSPAEATLPPRVRDCPEIAYRTLCAVAAEATEGVRLDINQRRGAAVYVGHARDGGYNGDLTLASIIEQAAGCLANSPTLANRDPGGRQTAADLVRDFRERLPRRRRQDAQQLGAAALPQLVAETVGFDGPATTFNSACASSLTALVQAVRGLQHGRFDTALVGGASYCHRDTLVLFSNAQSLSATGSRPFDAAADGLIVGEGYAAIVLKRLDDAVAAGDTVHAVIRGVGVAADGKGKSLWAPRREGQVEAIRRANRGLDGLPPQYIEAHATSTQLGDATETQALAEAFPDAPVGSIAVGSIKANIGHTLETAGLSGLLKTVLCLKHQTLPLATNLETPNPQIDWARSPLRTPRAAEPWPAPGEGHARRAAVNAFGIGGLNVHVVLEEPPAAAISGERGRGTAAVSANAANSSEPAVVVGMGAMAPGALTADALLELRKSGRDPKGPISPKRWDASVFTSTDPGASHRVPTALAAEVKGFEYDWRRHKVPPKQVANASPMQFMVLESVDAALAEAAVDFERIDRRRVGVVVGTRFGGEFANQLMLGLRLPDMHRVLRRQLAERGCSADETQAVLDEFTDAVLREQPALLDETGSFTSSSLASRITKTFDLMGGGFTLDASDVSAGAVLMCAEDLLRGGDLDLVVCVAAQQDLGIARYEGLHVTGSLAAGTPASPLDADGGGQIPGEGCGVLLLTRQSTADEAGLTTRAVLRGVGASRSASPAAAARAAAQRAERAARQVSADPLPGSTANHPSAGATLADVARVHTVLPSHREAAAETLAGLMRAHERAGGALPTVECATAQLGHCGAAAGMLAAIEVTHEAESAQALPSFAYRTPSEAVRRLRLPVLAEGGPLQPAGPSGRLATAVHLVNETDTTYHLLFERGSQLPANTPSTHDGPNAVNRPVQLAAAVETLDGVPHFDATEARRQAMRDRAASGPAAASAPEPREAPAPAPSLTVPSPTATSPTATTPAVAPVSPTPVSHSAPAPSNGHAAPSSSNGAGNPFSPPSPAGLEPAAAPAPAVPATPVAATPSAATAQSVPATPSDAALGSGMSASELEEFLVNFVVEQTGYPPEIVELDADLEADLGIDSIKKAQLFGELREHFDVMPDERLTLDDFPSLRSIADFLLNAPAAGTAAPPAQTPVAAPTAEAPHPATAAPASSNGHGSNGHSDPAANPFAVAGAIEPSAAASQPTVSPAPSPAPAMASAPAATQSATSAASGSGMSASELQEFLVNFVVEQTGYPPEIVELDADLEADLGIDSIKKAQLFGELREHFDVMPDERLTLDDFPSLRSIADFLLNAPAASGS